MASFNTDPSDELITECTHCSRCKELASKDPVSHSIRESNLCSHCSFERLIRVYDSLLFDRAMNEEGENGSGRATVSSVAASLILMMRQKVQRLLSKEEKGFLACLS